MPPKVARWPPYARACMYKNPQNTPEREFCKCTDLKVSDKLWDGLHSFICFQLSLASLAEQPALFYLQDPQGQPEPE